MKARLLAVQRMLFTTVVFALAFAVLAFPRGNNRAHMAALEEISGFAAVFQQKALESSLLSYAQSQGVVGLAAVAAQVSGPSVPVVQAKAGAAPITPRADITMRTLGEVYARSIAASTMTLAAPSAAELGASIAWRLARKPGLDKLTLTKIELASADVTDAALVLERSLPELRHAALAAEPVFTRAQATLTAAEALFDQRRKWKASWKAQLKADEARKEARVDVAQKQTDLEQKRTRYESAAKKAEAYAPGATSAAGLHAIAKVTLEDAAGKAITLRMPVALTALAAQVPALAGATFPATHAAGLWDEVKDKSAADALAAVRQHFTWHYQYVEAGGLKLGGLTLLHLLPPVLPALLFLLLLRIRRVSVSYNPFGSMDGGDLPRVGLGPRVFDLVALTLLPFCAAILATISLTAISQIPVLPVISAFVALGLGAYDFVELGSLRSLSEAVARSHSTPPPPKPSN